MKYKKIISSAKGGIITLKDSDYSISKQSAIIKYGNISCGHCGVKLLIRKGKGTNNKFAIYIKGSHEKNCKFDVMTDCLKRIEENGNVNIFLHLLDLNESKIDPYKGKDKTMQTTSSSNSGDDVKTNAINRSSALLKILEDGELSKENVISLDNPLIINGEEDYKDSYVFEIIYSIKENQFHHYNGITRHEEDGVIKSLDDNDFITNGGAPNIPQGAMVDGTKIFFLVNKIIPKVDSAGRKYVRVKYTYLHHIKKS